jgi:hypothetical protein
MLGNNYSQLSKWIPTIFTTIQSQILFYNCVTLVGITLSCDIDQMHFPGDHATKISIIHQKMQSHLFVTPVNATIVTSATPLVFSFFDIGEVVMISPPTEASCYDRP